MIIVPNFCQKDWSLMVKNLQWQKELDGILDFECLLAYDDSTNPGNVKQVEDAARAVYPRLTMVPYPASVKKTWPAGPNWGWQYMARYIAALHKDSWLWLEADAIPIRKNWLKDIVAEYNGCGQPFMGHCVEGMGHLNGVAVYPNVVAEHSVKALMVEESAWDVVLGDDIQGKKHHAHTLFQHCWCINPADGRPWNGSGELVTFKTTHDVVRLVDLTMALYHRNKDGTLIDMLRTHYAHPELAMVPSHTNQNDDSRNRDIQGDGKDVADVGQTVRTGAVEHGGAEGDSGNKKNSSNNQRSVFTGKCEILYVTYHRDANWLRYSLQSIKRWAIGFSGVTVVIPKRDKDAFAWLNLTDVGCPLRVQLFDEREGKGMLHHMVMMAGADKLCPKGTTHVLHVDSDVIFKELISPDSYFDGDKPDYVVRSWESLTSPDAKVVSDCLQWRQPTDDQLAFKSKVYTMCRHPTGFPIDFYEKYRNHIEKVKNRNYSTYMLSGKNEHPANRMDFTAMGAFAYEKMNERFNWIDISEGNHLAPRDLQKCYWSHGGITPAIEAEIKGMLT